MKRNRLTPTLGAMVAALGCSSLHAQVVVR
jgi:hypothetical protein